MSEDQVFTPVSDLTDEDKQWGMLSWLPFIGDIMAIIILLTEERKNRPFQKYNAVLSLCLRVIGYVVSSVLTPVAFIGCIVGIALLVYTIILMLKAKEGEWVEVPFLSDFVKQQGWAEVPSA